MTDHKLRSAPESLHHRLMQNRWRRIGVRLHRSEVVVLLLGVLAVLVHAGAIGSAVGRVPAVSGLIIVAMLGLTASRCCRYFKTVSGHGLERLSNARLILPLIWLFGSALLQVGVLNRFGQHRSVWGWEIYWTEIVLVLMGFIGALSGCRVLATRTHNSAVLLVGSFLLLVILGTILLSLPMCRPAAVESATPWHVALFTATSASCVTGLIVEPTGSYWSPIGHAVIFCLFQVGGLGILTFGAFIAILSGRRGLQFREARTLRDMLNAETVQQSRRLLLTILLFTALVEIVGAISLLGLWPDKRLGEQIWYAAFHSVSAFCNAGFSLQDDGFVGMGGLWQVWGPLTMLIILGGLGFPVVHDLSCSITHRLRGSSKQSLFDTEKKPRRLNLNSRLVLWSTAALLFGGAMVWFLLESIDASADSSTIQRAADAWFQSVTFRTAGFNTVDHGAMHPASKLLATFLMFIGAAPGSTGGGVKTIVFALTLLNIWAVFRGRDRVEAFGRSIPATQVARALSMIAIGLFIVMGTAGLLVIFERQPERFIDHLYEATSAFATVGVSTGITAELTLPSRLLICIVMFLGRVGPITLLLAMASPAESNHYDYPEERVMLG